MSDLVTLPEVKAHLRIAADQDDENIDIYAKLHAAQAIVLSHLTQRDETFEATRDGWTAATVPLEVKHAILIQVSELYGFRGDNVPADGRARGALSPAVESLLMPYKDPGVA